jgi:F0F1-type ATP synthase epsilon subunit
MTKIFKVKVRDIEHIIFEGETDRISSYNEVGPFDIYPMHANFISIIRKEITIYLKGKVIKDVKFGQAVLKVKQDIAHIYLGMEALLLEEDNMVKGK